MSTEAENNMVTYLWPPTQKDLTKARIAGAGFVCCEFMIQGFPENALALEHVTGINERVLRHQGSDFFGGAAAAYSLGQAASLSLHKLSKAFLPEKATKAIEKYYPYVRSAITLGIMGTYEGYQSVTNNKPYDFKDLAAYGLGMLVISNSYDLFQDVRRFIDREAPSDRGRISFPKHKNV